VTKKELSTVFKQLANDEGVITPLRMFQSTQTIFTELCMRPEYKAYYVDHLKDPKYYHYGSDRLFQRLLAKQQQRLKNEEDVAVEVFEEKMNTLPTASDSDDTSDDDAVVVKPPKHGFGDAADWDRAAA